MVDTARWRARLPGVRPERALRDWLREPGSLTARLLRHCERFSVRVLRQDCSRPLAGSLGEHCLPVREVLLECDGVPVVFAHSVLSTVRSGRLGRWFARLGSRSLGSLLFIHPGFRRGPIEFVRLDRQHPLHRRVVAVAGDMPALWARRSCHRLGQDCVLVTEVFLPALDRLSDVSAAR